MNEEIIMGMVTPYLKGNEITYYEFEEIFSMLSLKEQYAVLEILIKMNIELVEEHHVIKDVEKCLVDGQNVEKDNESEFEIFYNPDLFMDNDYDSEEKSSIVKDTTEYLKVREKILLSNKTLIKMIQKGDAQAKQDLCIKNHGLVDKWVNIYQHVAGNKTDFDDLEQAGMLGMIKAAEKFDLNMGTEFSTYAVWWIKQAIVREIMDNGYTIRIPVHKMEQIQKVLRFDMQFAQEIDYYKRLQLISDASGMSIGLIEECLTLFYQFINSTSLDTPIGEDEDVTIGELISDENGMSVEENVIQKILKERMDDVLQTLNDREQKVLRLRFGMIDGRERTLDELGREFGVTRERIRQIESKALCKLRHPTRSHKLKDFLN